MTENQAVRSDIGMEEPLWLRSLVEGVFAIEDITTGAMGGRAVRMRGRFLVGTAQAYARLAPVCRARGWTLMLRREGDDEVMLLMEGVIRPAPNNTWLPVALAGLTVISVLFSYVLFWEATEFALVGILRNMPKGWAFALSLLSILLAHEMGHYLTARHFGVAVTLPYLIPFPISPFGTMGAVIRMKDIPPSKRVMLLIGAAGPLAGLAVGIPVLLLGLHLSQVAPLPAQGGYSLEGNSLLYAVLKFLVFGRLLPSGGMDVSLHPVAFAGWAGLLVTSFNLIPAGQLDGGHIAYALLGAKTRQLNWVIIAVVLVMGIFWQGWLLWAALIFVFSRVGVRPMDDVTPLSPREMALAVAMLIAFCLMFTPLPLRVVL